MKNEEIKKKIFAVKVSEFFTNILNALLKTGKGPYNDLICTSDGHILASKNGDIGYNFYLCSKEDLNNNLKGLANVAGLTEDELNTLLYL
jgi:hypothetical protein